MGETKHKTGREAFKDSRSLLILLGFICQGIAWDNYFMAVVFVVLWSLCLVFSQKKKFIPGEIEFFIFFVSITLAFVLTGNDAYTRFQSLYTKTLAIGNGLLVLQAMRMLWPLAGRDKLFSIAIAITHLAIGSQVILGYPFLAILIAAIILLPQAISEVMSEGYKHHRPFVLFSRKLDYVSIVIIMVLFFMIFPRYQLLSNVERGMMMAREKPMSPEMETAGGGGELSDNTIFQIQGNNIGYLKSYALDTFDGNTWTANRLSFKSRRRFKQDNPDSYDYREVSVKNLKLLGNSLPVDGHVVNLRGNFFMGEYITLQDNVVVSRNWLTNNNEYEYWTDHSGRAQLARQELERCLAYPEQSERLKKWLTGLLASEKDPEAIALRIEGYIQKNIEYQLGAPDLNRLNPVEDFIFNEKKGHCGRVASAMALLLRMAGVPSRVAIGYSPSEKNRFADFYNIKARNGHAWAEAYIPDKGWQRFDATPVGDGETVSLRSSFSLSILDWVEYVWYSKIVGFSTQDQRSLLTFTGGKLKSILALASNNISILLLILLILSTVFLISRYTFKNPGNLFKRRRLSTADVIEATHFYGKMLRELAKRNFHRQPCQTPFEFLKELEKVDFRKHTAVRVVTENFCSVKYGEQKLNDGHRKAITGALAELRR